LNQENQIANKELNIEDPVMMDEISIEGSYISKRNMNQK
jgi:hypothetical protein